MPDKMRIGELAARFGLNPKTIRYYETIGVLPRAGRSASGYRTYDEQDSLRLSFIRRAKRLGFSLDDIRALLHLQEAGSPPCEQVLALLDQKMRELEQQIAELQVFRTTLASLRASWTTQEVNFQRMTSPASICPLIEQQEEEGEPLPLLCEFALPSHR